MTVNYIRGSYNLPYGGLPGYVPVKSSANDFDVEWRPDASASLLLKKFRSAVGKVRAGVAGGAVYRGAILCIGDSKTMGAGADGSAGNTAGAEPLSKPSQVATILNAAGIPIVRNSSFGFRGTVSPAALTAYDGRNVFDPALGLTTAVPTLGGYAFTMGGLTLQQFTPTGSVDTAEIFTRQSSGDGTLGVDVDAGANVVTVAATGVDAIIKTAVPTGALGAHVLKWHRNSGSFIYVLGIRAWNSTTSGFDLINAGAYGSTSSFHVTGAWSAINVIPLITNLALTFIQLGTNDPTSSIPTATTLANIRALAVAAKAAGSDVVLECPTYGPDGQGGTDYQREQLRLGIFQIGQDLGCAVADHATRFVSYADAFANGFMGVSLHETGAGYADEAQFLANLILN